RRSERAGRAAGRPVRHQRALRGRRHRRGGRELPARVHPQPAGAPRPGLPGDHADVPGTPQRGERHAADRISENAQDRGSEDAMTAPATDQLLELPAEHGPPRTNYLTADYGIRSWRFTVHHKRIALFYLPSSTVLSVRAGP